MIAHIDMDAFFASVEQRDNPRLRGKPVAVAGRGQRAVVAAASYEARKFGIHSAMPVFTAKKRCPGLIVVPGNKSHYKTISVQIMGILGKFSPLVEPVSIDEAYLDITGCERLLGSPFEIGQKIKEEICCKVGLSCSVGIAPVKFLAKIASDMQKPHGLTLIPQENVPEVIASLPIEKVPGVGRRTMTEMERLQIQTLGDARRFPAEFLEKRLGKWGIRLHELSRGMDTSPVAPFQERKSISSETTLDRDIDDASGIRKRLLAHSQQVARDLRAARLNCSQVSIKIRFADFTQVSRSHKLHEPICSSKAIFEQAVKLYQTVKITKKIRLIGVGASRLQDVNTPRQQCLFQTEEQRMIHQWEAVDTAIDAIGKKLGDAGIVVRGSLIS